MSLATSIEQTDTLGVASLSLSYPFACKLGLTALVEHMLDQGVDPTTENYSGLMNASESGHDAVLALILSKVDPRDMEDAIIEAHRLAITYKRDECAELLSLYM